MILKVQRPIHTNDPDRPWLIYGKNRTDQVMLPERDVPAALRDLVGDRAKVYVRATVQMIDGAPAWTDLVEVEAQPW